jgi:hypothetical protein
VENVGHILAVFPTVHFSKSRPRSAKQSKAVKTPTC